MVTVALPQVLADIRPNEEHAANHILRNPTRTGVQAVPSRSEHDVSKPYPCCLFAAEARC